MNHPIHPKENTWIFKEMTDNQRRILLDTIQLYDAFMSAYQKGLTYSGGMHWKKVKGKEYLFRTRDRYGYGNSLGVRSAETEAIYREFHQHKEAYKQRLNQLQSRLDEQARFCKAAMIQRVPRLITTILRLLDRHGILGKNVMVVGTYAMYAYETAAGVFLDSQYVATRDIDLLWDVRPKLKLIFDGDNEKGILGILKKADRSFEPIRPHAFRAVNQDGFMVDLIKAEPRSIHLKESRRMGKNGDLEAAEIKNLQWLISSPKFTQTVIGDDGYPALMVAPDPRSFAIHKLWLSRQSDREPIKKKRDAHQGIAIAQLVIQYLPQYPFNDKDLRMFPKSVFENEKKAILGIA